jgi:hypothetical protein
MFALGMSAFGFYVALTTKLRRIPQDPAGVAYSLKLFAKGGGWMFAIGGLLGAIRILIMLLDKPR